MRRRYLILLKLNKSCSLRCLSEKFSTRILQKDEFEMGFQSSLNIVS